MAIHKNSRGLRIVWLETRKGRHGRRSYRLRWTDPATGRKCSEHAGRDYAGARRALADLSALLRRGELDRPPDKHLSDLRDALDTFMAGKSGVTLRKTRHSLDQMIALSGDLLLARVDREQVMRFRAARLGVGVEPATVNKDLRQIRSALTYAVDAHWLTANPLLKWRALFLREAEVLVRVVEPPEFERLCAAAGDGAMSVLLVVSYYQGLRRHELCKLRWSDVDLERGTLRVINVPEDHELTKSRKNRITPLRAATKAALEAHWQSTPKGLRGGRIVARHRHVFCWPDGHPWNPDWVSRAFADLVTAAGLAHCTLHDLRRSWSTLAQRAGIDRSLVKDMGGWSSLSVVERHYTGEVSEAHRRATEQLDRPAGAG